MQTLIHRSPIGALDIPDVGIIEPGVPFDVSDDLVEGLLIQDIFEIATKAEIRAAARSTVDASTTDDAGSDVDLTDPEGTPQ